MPLKRKLLKELEGILKEYADDANYKTYEVDLGYCSNGRKAINTYYEFDGDSTDAKRGLAILKELDSLQHE